MNTKARVIHFRFLSLSLLIVLSAPYGCAPALQTPAGTPSAAALRPDPRVGLRGGLFDAEQAAWNLRLVSTTPPPPQFLNSTNSDLAFRGNLAFQGSYNGYQVWDISDPTHPTLRNAYFCPASQSDVSVYRNLLFVSGESLTGRIDCGGQGVKDTVSSARLRGIRIFDISDINNPRNVANVQTCRGSHTHTLLVDPKDTANVYVYISGSAPIRSPGELQGCVSALPESDPNSAYFRIEVIKVPLAHPDRAAIVNSPRIFSGLAAPVIHPDAPEDVELAAAALSRARATGGFIGVVRGREQALSEEFTTPLLDSIVTARGGTAPTAADTAALRAALPSITLKHYPPPLRNSAGELLGPNQCHDITVYPAIGYAGGACAGYGLLLDIHDPANPIRVNNVGDPNFAYWHSATFNNDGSKILFSDEWGGGSQPKCRPTDKHEWGADAIFTVVGREMTFRSYYKLPAPQTSQENCVAHNGSLIPVPGRDVMVQAWYQGGISVFDFTDAAQPREIAFFDRGPVDSARLVLAGYWSAYWYNGVVVSSEILRGLDILELTPSPYLSQNEIDAAKTVRFDYLNPQGQPQIMWPPTFALARAYIDQLERSKGLTQTRIASLRSALGSAETAGGAQQRDILVRVANEVDGYARGSTESARASLLADAVRQLAGRKMP